MVNVGYTLGVPTSSKKKLRILTNNVHTSYSCELARLGHHFFVEDDKWDFDLRPKPENWKKTLDRGFVELYDLILVNHDWELAERYSKIKAPMIFSILADCSEGVFPEKIEERVEAVTFLGKEVYDRWRLKNPLKKRILELGLHPDVYVNGDRALSRILTVGCNIGKRWDKGHCPLVTVSKFAPITVVGPGNDDIPGAIGYLPYEKLLQQYSSCQMYFNPGPIVGISMVEAMMSGMPLVTFRTINLTDLIQNGVNGFVVDTVDGAVMKLRQLQDDPGLRMSMGAAAQETAFERFSFERWARNWEYLFSAVVKQAVE